MHFFIKNKEEIQLFRLNALRSTHKFIVNPFHTLKLFFFLFLLGFLNSPQLPAKGSTEQSSVNLDLQPRDVIFWSAISAESYSDGYTVVKVNLRTEQEFTIYHSKLKFTGAGGLPVVNYQTPDGMEIIDPITLQKVEVFSGGEFTLLFQDFTENTADDIELSIRYIGCTKKICLFPFTEKVFVPNKRKYVPIPASLKSSFTEAKPVEFVLDKKETRSSSKTLSEKTNLDNFSTTENKQQTKTIKEPKASLEESLASKFQEQKNHYFGYF